MTRREELILVAGEATADLILALEAHGGDLERDAARLIEWFIDERRSLLQENAESRARLEGAPLAEIYCDAAGGEDRIVLEGVDAVEARKLELLADTCRVRVVKV